MGQPMTAEHKRKISEALKRGGTPLIGGNAKKLLFAASDKAFEKEAPKLPAAKSMMSSVTKAKSAADKGDFKKSSKSLVSASKSLDKIPVVSDKQKADKADTKGVLNDTVKLLQSTKSKGKK